MTTEYVAHKQQLPSDVHLAQEHRECTLNVWKWTLVMMWIYFLDFTTEDPTVCVYNVSKTRTSV